AMPDGSPTRLDLDSEGSVRRLPIIVTACIAATFLATGPVAAQDSAVGGAETAAADTAAADTAAADAASAGAPGAATAPGERPAKPGKLGTDRSRLTRAEIEEADLPTAYELVERLRRPWLRRDALTGGEVVVYMDDHALGGADALREIPAVEVAEMEYLPHDQAVLRWGGDLPGAVIVVRRR
ncbi:MAG TPA: hypothetical protein VNK43_05305, partial [Gemmatimonadales bacterium]|nr:hypothetical protein [Gemmatimonadales bacterium]